MKDSARRFWINWGLIGAAGFAFLAVVLTQTLWTSAEREARASHLVVGFRADDVNRIELVQASKRAVVVRAEATAPDESQADEPNDQPEPVRFRVTEPFQGEAEESAVDGLLRAVEFATALRRVDDTTFDRAAAGLDNPEQVIVLFMGDVEVRLRFGTEAKAPTGSRYVEVAGQGVANRGVYVVSQSTARDLMLTPDAFRIKQLVPYAASALRKVILRGSNQDVVLSFDDTHKGWRVQHGNTHVRVSRLARERLFAAFARSELERILDDDTLSPRSSTSIEVELSPRDAKLPPTKLTFGGKCPDAPDLEFATRIEPERTSGCTRALHLDTFLEHPETLIDDGLLSLRTDEIEEVSITRGERVLELARRDSAWVMRRPQEGQVEKEVGQAFVQSLTALRGEVTTAPENPQTDVVVVVHTGGDNEAAVETQSFQVTLPTATGVFVHRLDDDVWLRVAPSVTQQLVPFDLLLRQSDLTGFDAKELKRVSVTTPEWHQSFNVSDQGKACTVVSPAGFEAEPSACLDVIEALRTLRAQSWIASSTAPQFGLETPGATIEWTLRDDSTHKLTVGALAKGSGYYATLDTAGAVFTVSKTLVEALTTLVVARAAFSIDPELLQSVSVKTHERHVELVRLGDEFVGKRDQADGDTLDPAQIQALIDALGLLEAEAAVELISPPERVTDATSGGQQRDRFEGKMGHSLVEVKATQSSADGSVKTTHFKVGVGDVYRDQGVYYAEPVTHEPHALFVLPRTSVARVLQALE